LGEKEGKKVSGTQCQREKKKGKIPDWRVETLHALQTRGKITEKEHRGRTPKTPSKSLPS